VIYVGTEYSLDYFISINPTSKQYPGMIEMRIDRPLGELQNLYFATQESLHTIESELKEFADHIGLLSEALIDFLNDHNLLIAKKEVSYVLDHALFVVEAWIPKNKVHELPGLLKGLAVHSEPIGVEKRDFVPTYIENKGIPRLGEDLIQIYDTPAITDKDPSSWVFWAFTLFFAFVVADGGYGLLYLGLAFYLKYKFPDLQGVGKRFLKMVMILSTACIIWGVVTASFFGLKIEPNSYLGRLSLTRYLAEKKADYHLGLKDDVYQLWVVQYPKLLQAESGKQFLHSATAPNHSGNGMIYKMLNEFTRSVLLEFSLIFGILHISLAFLRSLRRHWAGIGWIAFLIGGYLYFPFVLKTVTLLNILGWVGKDVAAHVGSQLIYGGIFTAVILSLMQKRLRGFGEITHVVQVFGNVLSYLRLYALGLAGSIMAETFNDLGATIGLALGGLVILIGHSVNILLGLMAGTIHGLRLNFIEWYHFCFEGGGRLLRPLMRLNPKA
jgi:V/A-type H+-transporting ATPase subunit I